jgi:hypothetical protein
MKHPTNVVTPPKRNKPAGLTSVHSTRNTFAIKKAPELSTFCFVCQSVHIESKVVEALYYRGASYCVSREELWLATWS